MVHNRDSRPSFSTCERETELLFFDDATLHGTTAQVVDRLKRENVTREMLRVLNSRFGGETERKAFIDTFNRLARTNKVHHIAYESSDSTITIAPEACGC